MAAGKPGWMSEVREFKGKKDASLTALDRVRKELLQQRLSNSADLYAEIYTTDDETQEWTDAALAEWPN